MRMKRIASLTLGTDFTRLLFPYNPFGDATVTPQPGPVFIHADKCDSFAGTGYPEGLMELPILVEAHHHDGSRSVAHRLLRGDESATLSELLRNEDVRTLHLRHADAGCFIARVDRAER